MQKEGDKDVKFGEFMVQLRKGVPHVLLLAGEERYYIDRALEAETCYTRAFASYEQGAV